MFYYVQTAIGYGTTMKPQSAKQKGRLLQQLVRKKILQKYEDLDPEDVRSTSMGNSGEDIQLSAAARGVFNFTVECKSLHAFAGYKYLDQASRNFPSNPIPIAVVKANGRQPVVIIDLDDFMELL